MEKTDMKKNNHHYHLTLSESAWQKLKGIAKENSTPAASIIRQLVIDYIAKYDKKKKGK